MGKSHPLSVELQFAFYNGPFPQMFFFIGTTSFHKIFLIFARSPVFVGFCFLFTVSNQQSALRGFEKTQSEVLVVFSEYFNV